MTDDERDMLLIGLQTDVKWIKNYIADLNKFKLAAIIAIIVALLGHIL